MSSKNTVLPFKIDYMPEEFVQVAQQEINETPTKKVYFLLDLKTKIEGEKTMKDLDFENDFLLQFLRVSKYNINAAFCRLQNYVNLRKKHPSFFTGVQDKISINSSYSWLSPLQYRSPDGCAVLVAKYGMWNTRDIPYEHLNRIGALIIYQALRNPVNQIKGFHCILDFKGTTLNHLKYGTPGNLLQIAQMYLECTPARLKRYHCVNCTLALKITWAIMAPFIPEKIKRRIIFHNHPEDLLRYYPKHTLPKEYGGELEDHYMHGWMKEANYQMGLSTPSGQKNIF